MSEFAVEKQFNKIFVLNCDSSNDSLRLSSNELFSSSQNVENHLDTFLGQLKCRLNAAKSLLNDLELDSWHRHTRTANPAASILWQVQNACKPELLTQAWLKFYQILETFPLVSHETKSFSSLHLCEAPGAFVAALNHHIQNNSKELKWSWHASSLNPHYEGNPGTLMVSDDRFMLKTLENWDFGPDLTGDILNKKTNQHFGSLGPFDLVTADGSIDCQEDPGEQEATVAALLAAETTAALAALCTGGHFVLKTFTWFENSSVSLLHLLCCSFKKVTAVKPVASKEGNSEVYLVCEHFKGLSFAAADALWGNFGRELSVEHVPECFIERIREASLFFLDLQTEAIEKNLALFESGPSKAQKGRLRQLQNSIASRFLETFNLFDPVAQQVAPNSKYTRLQPPASPWTFAQMQHMRSSLRTLKITEARVTLETLLPSLAFSKLDLPVLFPPTSATVCVRYGQPFDQVSCSKFCAPWLLQLRNFCLHLDFTTHEQTGTDFVVEGQWMSRLGSRLEGLPPGHDFRVTGFTLFSYLDVGILCLLSQQFEETQILEITPRGCTFNFASFKGFAADFAAVLQADLRKDGLQLLEVVPLAPLLYGAVHPVVEQANEQTVLRLAQATLALLPEKIEVTD